MTSRTKRLAKARKIRSRMSAHLRALKMGDVTLRDVLEDSQNTPLRRAKIFDILRSAPHISDAGAKKICLTSQVWPLTRLEELSKYELEEILRCLPPRAR